MFLVIFLCSVLTSSNAGTYTTVMSNVDLSNTTYWGAVTERYIYTDGVSGTHHE